MKRKLSGVLEKHWWQLIVAVVIAGFLTEFINEYVYRVWTYHKPWSVFFFSGVPVGAPLILGWIGLAFLAFVFTIVFKRFRPRTSTQLLWVAGWVVIGFILEFVNSTVWMTWHYTSGSIWTKAVIPFLNFGLFVPVVGWGAVGLITFWAHKYLLQAFGHGKKRDPVCLMRVHKTHALSLKRKGKTFFFCSKSCLEEFRQEPEIYLKGGFL